VNAALRKQGLPLDVVRDRIRLFSRFETVTASSAAVLDALDLHALHKISFWDALIVQAASQSGCVQLLAEDLQAGTVIAGVRIVNSFPVTQAPAKAVAGRGRRAGRQSSPARRY